MTLGHKWSYWPQYILLKNRHFKTLLPLVILYKAKGFVEKQVVSFGVKIYIVIYSVIFGKFIFSKSSKKFGQINGLGHTRGQTHVKFNIFNISERSGPNYQTWYAWPFGLGLGLSGVLKLGCGCTPRGQKVEKLCQTLLIFSFQI